MKTAHVLGWYFPDSSGGSEVYVSELSRELRVLGHEVVIAAPHDGQGELTYEHEGVRVYRYSVGDLYSREMAKGVTPPQSVDAFAKWLSRENPDLIHFHSWTHGAGYWHIRKAHELGYPIFLTPHTASAFCSRGTMWRWDRVICDGKVTPVRCTACYLEKQNIPRSLAVSFAVFANALPFVRQTTSGRLRTAAELPNAFQIRQKQLQHTWEMCAKVIAVCEWIKNALSLNGCPDEKLFLCRQGANFAKTELTRAIKNRQELRVGFLGRLDYIKGARILVRAVRSLPSRYDVRVELKGIPQDQEYLRSLNKLIDTDSRVSLIPPSPPREVENWLRTLDLLVVPSRWMETGPLVIYEAFAAGVPVVGARHGGIQELVRENVNGLLFEPNDSDDLARILRHIYEHREILTQLQAGIGNIRSMQEVAKETDQMYRTSLKPLRA
jgi:glycosyltransferase involved in cell wall biosynthesis